MGSITSKCRAQPISFGSDRVSSSYSVLSVPLNSRSIDSCECNCSKVSWLILARSHSGGLRGNCHQRKMTSRLDINRSTLVTADFLRRCPVLYRTSIEKPILKSSGRVITS